MKKGPYFRAATPQPPKIAPLTGEVNYPASVKPSTCHPKNIRPTETKSTITPNISHLRNEVNNCVALPRRSRRTQT